MSGGACNHFWTARGIPYAGPYAAGPESVLYSERWPEGGYVTELDVHLDPAWSAHRGVLAFFYPTTVFQLAATIFERDYVLGTPHPAPHWVALIDAVPGEEALSVHGHRIEDTGWYTFRFVFSDEQGEVRVTFELRERRGGVLTRVELPAKSFAAGFPAADVQEPLLTRDHGSGHIWFIDLPPGLAVPIDEHRVRRGR